MSKLSPEIKTTMGAPEWVMLISLGLIWGVSFYLMAIAVAELPVFSIVFHRVGIAAVTLWIIVLALRIDIPTNPQIWLAFLVMGLLNNAIPFSLIVWGQQHIASGLAAILNGTTPLFALVLAALLLKDEHIGRRKLFGVLIGFVGVVVMVGPEFLKGLTSSLAGQLCILGAAISYAFAGTYGRRFRDLGVSPLVTAAGQVTASTLLLLPVTLIVDKGIALPGFNIAVAIMVLAVVCTAFAYLLYFKILASAGAANLSLVTLIVPVTAILLGTIILDEKLKLIHGAGMLLIAIGMLIIDGRLWHRLGSKA